MPNSLAGSFLTPLLLLMGQNCRRWRGRPNCFAGNPLHSS